MKWRMALAVAVEARAAVREVALVLLLADGEADVRSWGERQCTHLPHWGREQRDDVVAGRDARHALADCLDHAGALVAEDGGGVAGRVRAAGGVEVGVADAAGFKPTSTSPGCGPSRSTSWTTSGLANSSSTAARILMAADPNWRRYAPAPDAGCADVQEASRGAARSTR